MIERISIFMTVVGLFASLVRGGILSSGDVIPDDPACWTTSTDAYVGETEAGAVTVDAASDVSSRNGHLGYQSGSTGTVTVSGAGSSWTNSQSLSVGSSGAGGLEVFDGGSVSNTSGYIGADVGSSGLATVSGAGSTWSNSSTLDIARSGGGWLYVSNGGLVSDTYGYIGYYGGADGGVSVSGADSTWSNSMDVHVGNDGRGALCVASGGAVSSRYGYIGYSSGSSGVASVSGAGATWANSIAVSAGFFGDGALRISNGGLVSNVYGYIAYDRDCSGAAAVRGDGSLWRNSNSLCIGYRGNGSLLIADGGLVTVSVELTIDDDEDGDSFVYMGSGGMLALAGDVDDSLGAFLDLIGGSGAIRYWDESVWNWADITGAAESVDYTLRHETVGDLAGFTVLEVIPSVPASMGDTNSDYIIDGRDLANLAAQFGGVPGDESADFNGDGRVGLEDFAALRAHFGSGAASAPDAGRKAVIPEPGSSVVLLLGLGAVVRRGKRRSG